MTKFIYQYNSRYIVRLNTQTTTVLQYDLNIRELGVADLSKMLKVMYLRPADIQKRFDNGGRCFAALKDRKIVGYFWARFGFRDFTELNLKFKLPLNQAWLYNAITIKSERGQGIYPNIIRYMAKTLEKSGIEYCYIDADPRNISSIRGLNKTGAITVACIRMKKIFSTVSYNITVFDEDAWQKLSSTIENFDQIQCAKKDGKCL